jgi:hypothetical protein
MSNLKFPFNGSLASCSQVGQDLFVLSALKGKTAGTYIEIGSGPSIESSNTYLLETEYNWKGVSVEYMQNYYEDHKINRKHYIEHADATKIDYTNLLYKGGIYSTDIDYASVDIDAEGTLIALMNLPFNSHRFAVITFEHDSYIYGSEFKNKSREFLKNHGYVLVAGSIKPPNVNGDYEDWWVHPDLIDPFFIESLKSDENTLKDWQSIIFK